MRGGEYFNWIGVLPDIVRDEILSAGQSVAFKAGQTLYDRTDVSDGVWRIDSGRIRMFLLKDTGAEFLLKICEPGETVGDLAAIDGLPFPVFAEAMTDVQATFIPASHINMLRDVHAEIDKALLQQFVSASRGFISLLERVTMHSSEKQVAGRLQWLLRSERLRGHEGNVLNVSQSDLALMLGTSRQTVNKALAILEEQGLIARQYGCILIEDEAGLTDFLALKFH